MVLLLQLDQLTGLELGARPLGRLRQGRGRGAGRGLAGADVGLRGRPRQGHPGVDGQGGRVLRVGGRVLCAVLVGGPVPVVPAPVTDTLGEGWTAYQGIVYSAAGDGHCIFFYYCIGHL